MSKTYHTKRRAAAIGAGRMIRPATRGELKMWVLCHAGLYLPERGVCAGHCSPLDYLEHVFFELGGSGDTVVWACRGGGKTMIGAAATLLDLVFKPGIQVRILGGSKEQSEKMYMYLSELVRGGFLDLVAGGEKGITRKGLALRNGSRVEILTQSERAVRGTRVQKMRCDEVELFDPKVWRAAQLTTRTMGGGKCKIENGKLKKEEVEGREAEGCVPRDGCGAPVLARGAVEVFSTLHKPSGLMTELVAQASVSNRKVFTWCVWDVVGRCVEGKRACAACRLWVWCGGRARAGEGFVPVGDVLALQGRAARRTWESEMLCLRPVPEHQVFAGFGAGHVRAWPGEGAGRVVVEGSRELRVEGVIAGIDYGWKRFVCVWVVMLRDGAGRRVAWVADEYVQGERDLAGHAAAIKERGVGGAAGERLALRDGVAGRMPALQAAVYYADVAGRQHDAHSGRTSEAVLKAAGLAVKSRAMNILEGIEALNRLIEPPETWGRAERAEVAAPRLLVDPRCVHVIAALTNLVEKDGMPVKDGVHDHLVDALRYALVGHDGAGGKVEVREY